MSSGLTDDLTFTGFSPCGAIPRSHKHEAPLRRCTVIGPHRLHAHVVDGRVVLRWTRSVEETKVRVMIG